jgi:hypothetical protein
MVDGNYRHINVEEADENAWWLAIRGVESAPEEALRATRTTRAQLRLCFRRHLPSTESVLALNEEAHGSP